MKNLTVITLVLLGIAATSAATLAHPSTGTSFVVREYLKNDDAGWTVPKGWSQVGGVFTHTPGSTSRLLRTVDLEPGHHYELTFHVEGPAGTGTGTVSIGGQPFGWFSHDGGWNFSFDFQATG